MTMDCDLKNAAFFRMSGLPIYLKKSGVNTTMRGAILTPGYPL